MTDQEIRLECLRLANCLDSAKLFYEWVTAESSQSIKFDYQALAEKYRRPSVSDGQK